LRFATDITPVMQAEWEEAQRRMCAQDLSQFVPATEKVKPKQKKPAPAAAGAPPAAAPAADAAPPAADDDKDELDDIEELESDFVAADGRTARALAKCGLTASLRATRAALRFWLQTNDDSTRVFPTLAPIALLVLSVPLGIAAVENSFNDLRTVQSCRRLNLSHANREIEMYLTHNRHLLKGLVLLPEAWFLTEF
jgi:hypothetical protein